MNSQEASGAIDVAGDVTHGTLFFDRGLITFGLLSEEDVAAIGVYHIDPESWLAALEMTEPGSDLSEALLAVGVPESDIAEFARDVVDRVVSALRRNQVVSVDRSTRPSPLGAVVRLDASEWFSIIERPLATPFGINRLTRIA